MKKLNRLTPAYKDNLWGGTRLKERYNKNTDMEILAESWELSSHPDGQSLVNGVPLYDAVTEEPEVLGTKCPVKDIPLLIKFIDAKQDLSIQVHPDDEYARRVEGDNGKTEMWYILEAAPGAHIFLGTNESMTKEEFKERIDDHSITQYLNLVPVKQGDVFLVRSGTLHAIGGGCLLIEIQERSNVTYRVYDYDRRDKDGNPRELHVDKALEVTNLEPYEYKTREERILSDNRDGAVELLRETEYFHTYAYLVRHQLSFTADETSFVSLTMTGGEGVVETDGEMEILKQGDSLFIPAGSGKITIRGNCEAVVVTL